jgi:hypothetical protein
LQSASRWKAITFQTNSTTYSSISSITLGLQSDATAGDGTVAFNISLSQYQTSRPASMPVASYRASANVTQASSYYTYSLDPSQFVVAPNSTYSIALTNASGTFWWQEVGASPAGCSSAAPTGTSGFTFLGTSLTTNSGSTW